MGHQFLTNALTQNPENGETEDSKVCLVEVFTLENTASSLVSHFCDKKIFLHNLVYKFTYYFYEAKSFQREDPLARPCTKDYCWGTLQSTNRILRHNFDYHKSASQVSHGAFSTFAQIRLKFYH